MATATSVGKMTFEEFARLNSDERYELVDGKLEKLMAPMPKHGWSSARVTSRLDHYLEQHDPQGFWGVEVDIPTLEYHGRRPDFVYYTAEDAAERVDLENNRVLGVPTLAIEVLSEGDERRDLIVKRREYARVGIQHYWILDPVKRSALTFRLVDGEYVVEREFQAGERLTSRFLPGFSIPLSQLFR
jgi:Uma2 family endonuclease